MLEGYCYRDQYRSFVTIDFIFSKHSPLKGKKKILANKEKKECLE